MKLIVNQSFSKLALPFAIVVVALVGLLTQAISFYALVAVLGLWGLAFALKFFKDDRAGLYWLSVPLVIILSLALATHQIPGFQPIALDKPVFLGESQKAYQVFFSYDKFLVGLILLSLLPKMLVSISARQQVLAAGIGVFAIYLMAAGLGIQFDFKFNQTIVTFMVVNLFVTCIAEECFFRLLIQDNLVRLAPKFTHIKLIAALVTSGLFLVAHTGFTIVDASFFIGVASLVYALVYAYTQSIYTAIGLHYAVNVIHIVFFTYPLP